MCSCHCVERTSWFARTRTEAGRLGPYPRNWRSITFHSSGVYPYLLDCCIVTAISLRSRHPIQLAKAAGARVVATTSSDDKAALLTKLGADHVINYRTDTDWGMTARALTTGQKGFQHIIDVGGTATLRQSSKAISIEGVISIVGFLGEGSDAPTFLEALNHTCIIRGIWIGSRAQFEDLVLAIEASDLHPVIDERVFEFDEAKEAYRYLEASKHVGKVCIRI